MMNWFWPFLLLGIGFICGRAYEAIKRDVENL